MKKGKRRLEITRSRLISGYLNNGVKRIGNGLIISLIAEGVKKERGGRVETRIASFGQ
jgi:hypothetical protein